jgi:phosphoribosylaminoimidazolecarboxamide formyltransferase/IMP cyclohydrolase
MTYKINKGKRILDIIIAPSVDEDALDLLKRKNGKLRLLINPELSKLGEKSIDVTQRIRHIRGGRLKQDNYTFIYDLQHPDILWSGKEVSGQQSQDMIVAWAIGSTSNSNTICIVKNGQLLSNGVGQQDRVTSAEVALMRAKNAGHSLTESCAYSDSFFPFPDGPKMLADAGVSAIITSRGSVKDGEVAEELTSAGVSMCTLPDSLARGFFGH